MEKKRLTFNCDHGFREGEIIEISSVVGMCKVINGKYKVTNISSATSFNYKELCWYEKLFHVLKMFYQNHFYWTKKRIQRFYDRQYEYYLAYFNNQKWQRFFRQHLN